MGIVVNINNGQDFEPLSEGSHAAVLADVVDLGTVDTQFGPKEKVRFVYITDEGDENGRTKFAFQTFNKSLHEKATLRKNVKQLRGGVDIEGNSFDLESLIGTQCQLIIQHSEADNGRVYGNVAAILKPNPKVRISVPQDFVRKQDKPASQVLQGNNGKAIVRPGGSTSSVRSAGGGAGVAAAVYAPAVGVVDDDIPI